MCSIPLILNFLFQLCENFALKIPFLQVLLLANFRLFTKITKLKYPLKIVTSGNMCCHVCNHYWWGMYTYQVMCNYTNCDIMAIIQERQEHWGMHLGVKKSFNAIVNEKCMPCSKCYQPDVSLGESPNAFPIIRGLNESTVPLQTPAMDLHIAPGSCPRTGSSHTCCWSHCYLASSILLQSLVQLSYKCDRI